MFIYPVYQSMRERGFAHRAQANEKAMNLTAIQSQQHGYFVPNNNPRTGFSLKKVKTFPQPFDHLPNHQKHQESSIFAPKWPILPQNGTNLQKITRSGYKNLSKKRGVMAYSI
jgi:hypothetical protein